MAFSAVTYAKSRTYTDETVVGGGAIKGKNCTIESITPITGGNEVTFKWTLDDGTVKTDTMDVMDGEDGEPGKDGKGIKRVYINEYDHFIVVYTDDTETDAGEVIVQSSVDSVNGMTGEVVIGKSDVGLENVDNTSDLDKPISTDTQAALDVLDAKIDNKVSCNVQGENVVFSTQ